MKFSVNRLVFLDKLRTVQLAISSKTTIPILTGVKIEVSQEGIKLTGSNADISIEAFLETTDDAAQLVIEETGSLVLQPARFFADIVNKLPDETFSFATQDSFQAIIKSATSSFKIHGIDADNYPYLPDMDEHLAFKLPVQLLKQVIQQTVHSVSPHETRPILTGVKFDIGGGKLKAVSTDSHRLSQRQVSVAEIDHVEYSVVIPGTSLNELVKILDDELEEVSVIVVENQILFMTEDTYLYSRLLEGNYPKTDQLIPTETNTQITLNIAALRGAVERASLLSHAGKNNIVTLNVAEGILRLTGQSSEVGSVVEDIPYISMTGDPIEISFNPDYLKQALQTFVGNDVTIEFISSLRPFIVLPAAAANRVDFVQLITPIRTR
ncbi:DNA polymerase III subunit beta [Allofustis seminis]|uniref:DNA polymerase III subunit beta n=1 Tax=Allofustis seminis TaxID=166939 RepID=UPI00036AC949|nr:DNA polymerase III subunit beta [Allofustis seminis]